MTGRRRIGQETEYAVRRPSANVAPFVPDDRSNHSLFLLIRGYITDHCHCLPGYRDFYQSQFFMENGGAFAYESLPTAEKDGLIEGATPECETPYEALCHQRAQEAWLIQAIESQRIQNDAAFQGCGLLKNCRDAEGHIYGSQENYEAGIGPWHWLILYRALICAAIPVTFLGTLAILALILAALFLTGLLALIAGGISLCLSFTAWAVPLRPIVILNQTLTSLNEGAIAKVTQIKEDQAARLANATIFPILFVLLSPFAWGISELTFRRIRRSTSSFLISRIIISGAGSLLDKDTFVLSEKTSALKTVKRHWATMASRSHYDSGNLLKGVHLAALDCFIGRRTNWLYLLHRRQRLQISCSDANRCEVAEYLKLGTTQLVVEMAEAGHLKNAPIPKAIVAAAHAINQDPTLKVRIPVHGGKSLSALEIQRWYHNQALIYLALNPDSKEIFQPIVDRWKQVLDTLEWDPEQLIGQLDWVTKKSLIEEAGKDQSFTVKKRIDLGYHELGSGYFERFQKAQLTTQIVQPEDLQHALYQPPRPRSAKLRSRFIRFNQKAKKPWTVGWNYAIRGFFLKQSRRVFERST